MLTQMFGNKVLAALVVGSVFSEDFESDVSAWTKESGTSTFVQSSAQAHSGTYSALFTGPDSHYNYWYADLDSSIANRDDDIVITTWVYSPTDASNNFGIFLSNDSWEGYSFVITPTISYTGHQTSLSATSPLESDSWIPTRNAWIRVVMTITSTGFSVVVYDTGESILLTGTTLVDTTTTSFTKLLIRNDFAINYYDDIDVTVE